MSKIPSLTGLLNPDSHAQIDDNIQTDLTQIHELKRKLRAADFAYIYGFLCIAYGIPPHETLPDLQKQRDKPERKKKTKSNMQRVLEEIDAIKLVTPNQADKEEDDADYEDLDIDDSDYFDDDSQTMEADKPAQAPAMATSKAQAPGGPSTSTAQTKTSSEMMDTTPAVPPSPSIKSDKSKTYAAAAKSNAASAMTTMSDEEFLKKIRAVNDRLNLEEDEEIERKKIKRASKRPATKSPDLKIAKKPATQTPKKPDMPTPKTTVPTKDKKADRPPKTPPIILHDKKVFRNTMAKLKDAGVTISDAKNIKTGILLTLPDPDSYRLAVRIMDTDKTEYHSYNLQEEKPLKIVIRGIPEETTAEEIRSELISLGYPIRNAFRMTQGSQKTQIPLILLDVEKSGEAKNIYKLTSIFGLSIQVEPLRRRTADGQCHRCQGFAHSASCCHATPMCVRCAGEHLTSDCKKKNTTDPAKCANCGGPHPANYRGCPRHPKHARYAFTNADKQFQQQPRQREEPQNTFKPAWMNTTNRTTEPDQINEALMALKNAIDIANELMKRLTSKRT